jgi:putative hydrolase of the HAD superfamily
MRRNTNAEGISTTDCKALYKAVVFDLDGTLYPNSRLYFRLITYALKNLRFLIAFDKARCFYRKNQERSGIKETGGKSNKEGFLKIDAAEGHDFYSTQAALVAKILRAEPEAVKERIEKQIYRGWEPYFHHVKLYSGVRETLEAFRSAGLKLGLLSDFPPEAKLKNLSADSYWDTVLCTERFGVLKPDTLPFLKMAQALELDPRQILFVGNSLRYDINGAKKAGMSAALIRRTPFGSSGSQKNRVGDAGYSPDFIFKYYRQLCNFVLQ